MEGPTSSWGLRNRITLLTLQEHDDDEGQYLNSTIKQTIKTFYTCSKSLLGVTCSYVTRVFVVRLGSVVATRWFCDVRSRDVVLFCSDSACLWSISCANNEGWKNDYMSFWNELDSCDVSRRYIPVTGQHIGASQQCQVLGICTEELLKGLHECMRSSTALFLSTSPILCSRFSH